MITPYTAYKLSQNNPSKFKIKKDYYESIIAKDFKYSYYYAKEKLKGRFEKGENIIMRVHPREGSVIPFWYYTYVIKPIKNNSSFHYKFI